MAIYQIFKYRLAKLPNEGQLEIIIFIEDFALFYTKIRYLDKYFYLVLK